MGQTYVGNYLTPYFFVRFRALASLLTSIAGTIGNVSIGFYRPWKQSLRAKVVWTFIASLFLALYIWQTILQVQ
jgi:hypothetical protein